MGIQWKVFCLSEDGATHVIEAGPVFRLLGTKYLGGSLLWRASAVADGKLLLRTAKALFSIQNP